MNTNDDTTQKNELIHRLVGMIGVILMIIATIISIPILAPSVISPFVKNLAKDERNIKNNGCVMQRGRNKYGGSIYSLNGQMSRNMINLTIEQFPFYDKWSNFNKNFESDFDEKYSKECFKVKYISTKTLWFSVDFIYDVDETQ